MNLPIRKESHKVKMPHETLRVGGRVGKDICHDRESTHLTLLLLSQCVLLPI